MHGTPVDTTEYVWVCFHGYGQLGKYFIQKFEFLDPTRHWVIAPEGLNKFYFEGVNERPLANWMTREDRLDEIADYVEFIENLRKKLAWDKNPKFRIIYLGFSQGVTTMLRWMMNVHPRTDFMLHWAGSMPDDILLEHHQHYFSKISTHFFVGNQDPYINVKRTGEMQSLLQQAGIEPIMHTFEGLHTVKEETLKEWAENTLMQNK
jgi:predicted esterase